MALTPEAKVKHKVVALLKAYGAYYFFSSTHGYGRSGIPDITVCMQGVFLGIESKANGGKPTELQKRELAAIHAAGGIALVVDETNLKELETILENIRAGKTITNLSVP